MGRTAVRMCVQTLAGDTVSHVLLKGRLVVRESARPK
jgi:DNA-binding LacI/PurR family transcriptional regulator